MLIENKYQTPSLQNQQDPYSLLKQDPISTPSRSSTDQARLTSTDQTRPTSTDQAPIVPRAPNYLSIGLSLWVCGCVCVWVCLCAPEEKEDEERRSHWVRCARRRERKKCANVKLCTDIVVIVYLYTSLHLLMWVTFCSNCVKIVTFFILHIYAQTDVIGIMTITERHWPAGCNYKRMNLHLLFPPTQTVCQIMYLMAIQHCNWTNIMPQINFWTYR